MVKKRSRKYDSDDNDSDSDVDFDFEEPTRSAPKKYSLRERKRTSLNTTDYYYGVEDDDREAKKDTSDDDFDVTEDPNLEESTTEPNQRFYEAEEEEVDLENPEGLIDYEDIIRADIVVNKNKIDYDNLINKTEIKVTPIRKRRGRKPKNQSIVSDENEEKKSTSSVKNEESPQIEQPVLPESSVSEEPKDEEILENGVSETNKTDTNDVSNPDVTPKVNSEIRAEDEDDVVLIPPKQDVIVLE